MLRSDVLDALIQPKYALELLDGFTRAVEEEL